MKDKLLFLILAFLFSFVFIFGCDENPASVEYPVRPPSGVPTPIPPDPPRIVRPREIINLYDYKGDPESYFVAKQGMNIILQIYSERDSLKFEGLDPHFKEKVFGWTYGREVYVVIGTITDPEIKVYTCKPDICSDPTTMRFIFDKNRLDSLAQNFLDEFWGYLGGEYLQYYFNPIPLRDSTGWFIEINLEFVVKFFNTLYHNVALTLDASNIDSTDHGIFLFADNSLTSCLTGPGVVRKINGKYYIKSTYITLTRNCMADVKRDLELAILHEIYHALGWVGGTAHIILTITGNPSDWYLPPFVIYAIDNIVYGQK